MNNEFRTVSRTEKNTKLKRDFILIATFLCAALMIYAFLYLTSSEGDMVVVKVDGAVIKELPLNQDAEFTVPGYQGGINSITIRNGSVLVSDADCPDKLCVKMGRINRAGETIVCLPHRVVVEIKMDSVSDNDYIDSVVR